MDELTVDAGRSPLAILAHGVVGWDAVAPMLVGDRYRLVEARVVWRLLDRWPDLGAPLLAYHRLCLDQFDGAALSLAPRLVMASPILVALVERVALPRPAAAARMVAVLERWLPHFGRAAAGRLLVGAVALPPAA